jgi:hypothetical protein
MTDDLAAKLARCDQEIDWIMNSIPTTERELLLMGIADWETEKVLILRESSLHRQLE